MAEGMVASGDGIFVPGQGVSDTNTRLFPAIGVSAIGNDTLVVVSADGEPGVRHLLSGRAARAGRVARLFQALPRDAVRFVFPPGGGLSAGRVQPIG